MPANQTIPEISLPALDVRALLRRAALPAALACAALATVLLAGGHVHAIAAVLQRGFGQAPGWVAISIVLEGASLAAYVWLLSLVAGRATPRIGTRESAQITLAGAAATRLLPTAGAGGAALTVWALRRTGLAPRSAARTLLAFMVVLYAVFLGSIVVAGGVLTLGLVHSRGPLALSAIPAVAALLADRTRAAARVSDPRRRGRLHARRPRHSALAAGRGARLSARPSATPAGSVRSGDPRLVGAIGYWAFDAAVLWAMLRAFGAAPPLAVVVLAYFVGQVSNTVPLPGSVSGGMTGAPRGVRRSARARASIRAHLPHACRVAAAAGRRRRGARTPSEHRSLGA